MVDFRGIYNIQNSLQKKKIKIENYHKLKINKHKI